MVVQRMVASPQSGVMFTTYPATHDAPHLVIALVWGLEGAIALDAVTLDGYLIDEAARRREPVADT